MSVTTPAQDRDERGQHQLAAHPDAGGQDVQEEANGIPADGEHPAIFPLPFAARRPGVRKILRPWKRSRR